MTNQMSTCTCCSQQIRAKRVGPFFYQSPNYTLEPIFEKCSKCEKFLGHAEIPGGKCFECTKEIKAELKITHLYSCSAPRNTQSSCVICGNDLDFNKDVLSNPICKNLTCAEIFYNSNFLHNFENLQNTRVKKLEVNSC